MKTFSVKSTFALTILSFLASSVSGQVASGKGGVVCSSSDLSATLLQAAGKVSGVAKEDGAEFVS
jgi:hypothetical protein